MYPELALLLPFVFLFKMKLRARLVCLGVTFITASVLMGFHVGRLSVQREMGDRWSEHSVQSDSAKKNLPDIPGPAHHHHSQKLRAKVAKEEPDYLQVVEQLDMKAKLIREADEILSKREMPKDQLPQKQIPKVEEGRNFPSPITLKPRNKSEIHHKQPDILENIPNQPKDKLHDQHLNPPAPPPANQQDQHQAVGRSQEGQAAEPASRQNPPAAPPPANQQRAETQNVANKNKQNIHYAGEPIEILPEPEPLKTVSVVPVADVFGREFLPHRECIHLSVVVCGDRTEETLIMLKSSAALTKRCLVFHIFAEDDLQGGIRDLLNSWPDSFKDRVTEYIYPITFPSDENKEEWKKVFKLCATQRLFLPDLLPNVDALLYVDTDILFIRPLEKIWHFFSKFNSSQLAALAPEHEVPNIGWYNRFARHPYYGKTGLNSGVMLMNLTRLRDFKWTNRIIPFYRQYRYKITWGDQDLINVVFYFHPDKVFEYPCEWNYRPDHCMYGNNCGRIETEGISVIHGNRGVYHNEKQLPFRSIYETFRDYQLGATISAGLVQPLKERWADSNLINMYCTKALRKPILSTLARYT